MAKHGVATSAVRGNLAKWLGVLLYSCLSWMNLSSFDFSWRGPMNEHMQTLILKHLYWPLLQVWKKQCKVLQALKVLNFQCQLDTKLEPSIYHTFSHIKTHSEISQKKKRIQRNCVYFIQLHWHHHTFHTTSTCSSVETNNSALPY